MPSRISSHDYTTVGLAVAYNHHQLDANDLETRPLTRASYSAWPSWEVTWIVQVNERVCIARSSFRKTLGAILRSFSPLTAVSLKATRLPTSCPAGTAATGEA
jgi:hypothetical protein